MSDMLVKLYALPNLEAALAPMQTQGIIIRRALAPDKRSVTKWVDRHWGSVWASECDVAFTRQPVSCILATHGERMRGFVCYEATCRNFLGPMGVRESAQGKGIGKALLLTALHAMRSEGYAYAIIGGVGPDAFYANAAGATLIEDSDSGIYGATF